MNDKRKWYLKKEELMKEKRFSYNPEMAFKEMDRPHTERPSSRHAIPIGIYVEKTNPVLQKKISTVGIHDIKRIMQEEDITYNTRKSLISRISKEVPNEDLSSKRSWVLRKEEISRNRTKTIEKLKRFEKIPSNQFQYAIPLIVQNTRGNTITILIRKHFTIKKIKEEIEKKHR